MSEAVAEVSPEVADEAPDLEVILPPKGRVVVDGIDCEVRRLKTREFLALLRILTAGLGPALGQIRIDFTNGETVGRDLSALMLLAVPNAFEEFTSFLTQIVDPLDRGQDGEVRAYLADNPELDVLIDVFEVVAGQEKDDLAVLGGKLQAMWDRLSDLYQPKAKTKKPSDSRSTGRKGRSQDRST